MASELRYCEQCGDVIQLEPDERVDFVEEFICPKCQGLTDASSGSGTQPGRRIDLEDVAESGDLDLFSAKTIEMQRRQFESLEMENDGPLQLTPSETGGSRGREPSPRAGFRTTAVPVLEAERDEGGPLGDEEDGGTDRPLKLVGTDAQPKGSATGGTVPAPTARKIVFRCTHCKATLAIRPVKATSRLTCPYCTKHIFVSQSGQFTSKPPSVALRHGSGALHQIEPGHVTLKKRPEGERKDPPTGAAAKGKGAAGSRTTPRPATTPAIVERLPSGASGSSRRGEVRQPPPAATAKRPPPRPSDFQRAAKRQPPAPAPKRPPAGESSVEALLESAESMPNLFADQRVAGKGAPAKRRSPRSLRSTRARKAAEHIRFPARQGRRSGTFRARIRHTFRRALASFFVTLTITVPILALGTLHHFATPKDGKKATPQSPPTIFETLGKIANQGVQELVDTVTKP